jgi:hypothetical protein
VFFLKMIIEKIGDIIKLHIDAKFHTKIKGWYEVQICETI